MAKRIASAILAMVFLLVMVPTVALAAAPSGQVLYVGNVQITSTGYLTTDGDGNVTAYIGEDIPTDNYIHYDAGNNTLTLHNAIIKDELPYTDTPAGSLINGAAIGVLNQDGNAELTIQLEGDNTIEDVSTGIYVLAHSPSTGAASLTITGSGSLTTEGSGSGSLSGILVQSNAGNANLTINNVDVTATNSNTQGIRLQSAGSSTVSLTVNGGELTASGKDAGIDYVCGNDLIGSGTPRLTVCGNTIVKASGDTGGITSNSSPVTPSGTGIVFNNGTGTVYGDVTLQEDLTIESGQTLDIPSGASLTIGNDATLTNEGTVTSSGTLTNNGTINNSGTLPNNIGGNTPPSITTTSLDGGAVGTAYNATLGASGENITWTWAAVTGSSLPPGLELSTNGVISGTPTSQGTSNFTVTASNNGGSDSEQLSITIDPATLSITIQPSNQSVTEGQTVSFNVAATGSGTLTYQWRQSTDSGNSWTDISGATNTTYTITTTTAAMSGYQYHCVVTDGSNNSVTSQAAVLTVTPAAVPVTGVTLSQTQARLYYNGTPNMLALVATVVPDNATNKAVAWTSSNSSVATVDSSGNVTAVSPGTATIVVTTADGGMTATCLVTVTGVFIPPRPTGPDWGDVADDISDAEPGSTVTVDMEGETVLPGEVLDELSGRDVTLALDMGGGLFWEICGGDVPADAEYEDTDLGVSLGGDAIPADVANLVTGEHGSVQVSLGHDGPFGFELTLVAPLGKDAAGLVANLYRYDEEAGSLGYEASARVDGGGAARLPLDHASSWLVALDSRTHELPFGDAAEGEWYSEAVRWAWLSGLMAGYGDGSGAFGTEGALSRAQLATVLWRQAGEPEAEGSVSFADCDPGAFYAEAVAWAAEQGIVEGYGDGANFGPEDPVTREQLATILWRQAGEPGGSGDLSGYPDGDDASSYAVPALEWAVGEGVLSGLGGGSLAPGGVLSRAQLAAVLMRMA